MPKVSDLTNATCSGWNSVIDCRGAVGATPSSGNNAYQRRIGAGFFTEWGYMNHYSDADFVDGKYWTSDVINNYSNFYVRGERGDIYSVNKIIYYYGVCTTP
ncbi:MAG: hypothetical protein J6563_08530, partial [Gilliamella sp.]|uniref:hypothetical protein n=1 Tax=Gilliamella sp. TaxID=1891236 RepID=UPI00262F15FA